jgi:hypothetical protein
MALPTSGWHKTLWLSFLAFNNNIHSHAEASEARHIQINKDNVHAKDYLELVQLYTKTNT